MPKLKVTPKKGETGWRGAKRRSQRKQKEITAYTTAEPRERRTPKKEPDTASPAKRQRRLRNEAVQRGGRGDDESASTSVTSSRPKRRQLSQGGGRVSSKSGEGSSENDFSRSSGSGGSDYSDAEGRTTTGRAATGTKRSQLGSTATGPPAKRQRRLQRGDVQRQRRSDESASEESSPRKYTRGGTRTSDRIKGRQPSQSAGGGRSSSRSGAGRPTAGEESSENALSGSSGSGGSDYSDTEGRTTTAARKGTRSSTESNGPGSGTSRLQAGGAISDATESDRRGRPLEARQKQRNTGKAHGGSASSRHHSSESDIYEFSESAGEEQSPRRSMRPRRVSFAQHGSGSGESPSKSPRATGFSRLGGGGGGSSQESESEGGGESSGGKRKASVREVQVAGSSVAKWRVMSQETRKVFRDVMLAGLGQCLEGVSGNRRRQVERELQQLITRVNQKLESTKAPKTTGKTNSSYSGMKQRIAELKEKCLSLVQRNQELEQKSEERKRSVEERQRKAEQLAGAASSSSGAPPTLNVEDYPEPPEDSDPDEEAFLGYVVELVGRSRAVSLHSRERMAAGGLL